MAEKKSFYDQISAFWQNNKIIAVSVFAVVAVVAAINAYSAIAAFVDRFDNSKARYAEFNRLVQPIYFKGRLAQLEDGQLSRLESVVGEIKGLSPNKIFVKSHTSRVAVAPNSALSKTRGEHIRDYMVSKGISRSKIVVVTFGGKEDSGLQKGYEQRVEIELGD
jgi:outer membrane protein OmpA-like peptidoglycan-associated protein